MDALTTLLPTLIASHSHLLYTSTLDLLPAFLPLLRANTDGLRAGTTAIVPALLDKVADGKERVYRPAEEALVRFGMELFAHHPSSAGGALSSSGRGRERDPPASASASAAQVWERLLLGTLEGKLARAKVGVMRVLVGVRSGTRNVGLKAWLPAFVAGLEDSDGTVRDEARTVCRLSFPLSEKREETVLTRRRCRVKTLVHLFSPPDIPPSAHAEVRKMMQARGMKPALIEGLMSALVEDGTAGAVVAAAEGEQAEGDVPRVVVSSLGRGCCVCSGLIKVGKDRDGEGVGPRVFDPRPAVRCEFSRSKKDHRDVC